MAASLPPRLPFSGSRPGQDVGGLVDNLTEHQLHSLLGPHVTALVQSIDGVTNVPAALRRIAVVRLRDELDQLMRHAEVRVICLDALSIAKRQELEDRVGVALSTIQALSFPQEADTSTWHRFLGFFGFDPRKSPTLDATPSISNLSPTYGLFPHQRRTVRHVLTAIQHGRTRVVLHMPTGSGKTRTTMHAICRSLNASDPFPIVWLANSTELLEQAADAFQEAWSSLGDRQVPVLRYWGTRSPDLATFSDGLLVAGLQKLNALRAKDPLAVLRLARPVRLVVVDEAHQAIAPTYRRTIELLTETGHKSALLGLTATPGRTYADIDEDARLSEFFSENKIPLDTGDATDPISFLVNGGYLARPSFRQIELPSDSTRDVGGRRPQAGTDYDPKLLDALASETSRSERIIQEIRRLVSDGHTRIILFSTSVSHAHLLASVLEAVGVAASAVTAQTAPTVRNRVITRFRKKTNQPFVLCNYGVLTTGFDAPQTSAALIARPTRSLVLFSQMLGRAIRGPKAGGNRECKIITVVDLGLPGFRDLAEAFTNWDDVWRP